MTLLALPGILSTTDAARREHLPSHRDRLAGAPSPTARPSPEHGSGPTTPTPLDAVVVPAYRSAAHLAAAADVAAASGSTLLVLCSGHVTARQALATVAGGPGRCRRAGQDTDARWDDVRVVAVDVRPDHAHQPHGPLLGTASDPASAPWRRHDAHLKRNLGIQLARLLGWRRILFHNDDVSGLTRVDLAGMLAVLDAPDERSTAVGWAFREFPDNSVVCHAHRLAGGQQDTFVSDAALALNVDGPVPFFPSVYNEDWLFLQPLLRRGEVVLAGDRLRQEPYDPFADPGRAIAEEFGDVLGEGLMRLEHLGEPLEVAEEAGYWLAELDCRVRLITQTAARLPEGPRYDDARSCLRVALAEHGPDWPAKLSRYVRTWQEDLRRWEKYLTGLPTELTLEVALARLGLRAETPLDHPS